MPLVQAQVNAVDFGKVVELDARCSPTTSTIVTCLMKRIEVDEPECFVEIKRSEDEGRTWHTTLTLIPNQNEFSKVDPIIEVTNTGIFYLIFMNKPSILRKEITLEMYVSRDDGQSWSFVNSPHSGETGADYPQITVNTRGDLFLTYTEYEEHPVPYTWNTHFRTLAHDSTVWSKPFEFEKSNQYSRGADISFTQDSVLAVSFGDAQSSDIFYFESTDNGFTWSEQMLPESNIKECITKLICNPNVSHHHILIQRPHSPYSPAGLYTKYRGEWSYRTLDDYGAYYEALLDDNGILHLTKNKIDNPDFEILYSFSSDRGQTFANDIILYSAPFENDEKGEYQSFFMDESGKLNLLFCDWSDSSSVKMINFPPFVGTTNSFDQAREHFNVYPNPVYNQLSIALPQGRSMKNIRVFDVRGNEIKPAFEKHDTKLTWDVTNLSSGHYFLYLEDGVRVDVLPLQVVH